MTVCYIYMHIACSWAYLQNIYKVYIYKTVYWYVCYDHKNTVLRGEHLKWNTEREYVENMTNYEKIWKIKKYV